MAAFAAAPWPSRARPKLKSAVVAPSTASLAPFYDAHRVGMGARRRGFARDLERVIARNEPLLYAGRSC